MQNQACVECKELGRFCEPDWRETHISRICRLDTDVLGSLRAMQMEVVPKLNIGPDPEQFSWCFCVSAAYLGLNEKLV